MGLETLFLTFYVKKDKFPGYFPLILWLPIPCHYFSNVHVIDVDLNATGCPSLTLTLYSWVIVYPILVERRDFYSH